MDKINADSDCRTAQTSRWPGNMKRSGIDRNDMESFRSPWFTSVQQIAK